MIPKVTNPELLKNFRPISLCNVIYKIASKVLANRLKLILPLVVSENQSAFVHGRLIIDNVLIAYECFHTIRQQRAKRPFFAVKVDMMKAYDRVEWNFLRGCLQKLGFSHTWIDTVMRCCVTSARYAVRVNGELTDPVIPSRGIRQGDPISPYLFLLCTEGLSCLLQQRADQGELQGLRNGRLGPPISHLYLQMIVYSSPAVMKGVWTLCSKPSNSIVRALVRKLILISHPFYLVLVVLLLSRTG
jgi:hypothetical protein